MFEDNFILVELLLIPNMSLQDWLFTNQSIESQIFTPQSVQELISFLQRNSKPISIAGAQYSSGGHTLVDSGVIISTQQFNHITDVDVEKKEYTVGSGITWQQIIHNLIQYNLVPWEMQSYYSFTVGGSISVNAHGRSCERISDSIIWIDIITSTGKCYRCSLTQNKELLMSIVGGYGLIGIIYQARLKARDNLVLKCNVYPTQGNLREEILYFSHLKDKVLYNSEISSTGDIHHIIWSKSTSSCQLPQIQHSTILKRLTTRLGENLVSLIQPLRDWRQLYHPFQINRTQQWLSYEMGYDAHIFQPITSFRYLQSLLQEYFVPLEKLEVFLEKLYSLIRCYRVNVLNSSIRWVNYQQPCSFLDYLQNSSKVAIVLYINVINFREGEWIYREFTQKAIELALDHDGTWYLPYYLAFTSEKLSRAYPQWNKLLEMKRIYDPKNRLQSKFYQYIISM